MDKFEPLIIAQTNGANYDLDTEGIIVHLKRWDMEYGITLSDITYDTVAVAFDKLPKDIDLLAAEVYAFCPDTVDQHFGCIDEMIEMADETGQEVPSSILELIEGVDLDQESYGVELLKKHLVKYKQISLWWD